MRIKPEEKLKILGPYGEIDAKLAPCFEDGKHPVLILAHGFRGSMEGGGRAALLASKASMFVNVLRFNFSGSQILSKQIAELNAVIDYARKRFGDERIFLLGRSMGGAASLVTASGRDDIFALALWATPNDLHATFKNALGEELYNKLKAGETLHLNDERGELDLVPEFLTDFDKYDLQGLLKNWSKRPLLIIHGTADETVNVEQGERSFALAGRPKKIVLVNGADHSFTNHSNKAAEEVIAWVREYLY